MQPKTQTIEEPSTARISGDIARDDVQTDLEQVWFSTPPSSVTRSSFPPPVRIGDFLGDPDVDAWLR
jgi:hypothetical protein